MIAPACATRSARWLAASGVVGCGRLQSTSSHRGVFFERRRSWPSAERTCLRVLATTHCRDSSASLQMRSKPDWYDECRRRHRYHLPTCRSGRKEQASRETKTKQIVRSSRAHVRHTSIEYRVDPQRSDNYGFHGIARQAGVVWPKVRPSDLCAQASETSISGSDQSVHMALVSGQASFFAHNERHTRTYTNRIAEVDLPKWSDSPPPFCLTYNRRVLGRHTGRRAAEGQDQQSGRFHGLVQLHPSVMSLVLPSVLTVEAHIQSVNVGCPEWEGQRVPFTDTVEHLL